MEFGWNVPLNSLYNAAKDWKKIHPRTLKKRKKLTYVSTEKRSTLGIEGFWSVMLL